VTTPELVPDDIDALKAALVAERVARQQAEARASGAEAMVVSDVLTTRFEWR